MRVVISQSMYFPWVGFLEQLSLADIFIVLDDVQFSKGSFTNRVQIKTSNGTRWLTVPLSGVHLGQKIDEVKIDNQRDWHTNHVLQLAQAYSGAPFLKEMLTLVENVFSQPVKSLSELSHKSSMVLAEYFGLSNQTHKFFSNEMTISGGGSQRVLDIVKTVKGKTYITGHGARRYLDHEAFEVSGIDVSYMKYQLQPYPQLHGEFTPFVSALDLVANCGREGNQYIKSKTIPWKEFLNEPT